MPRKNNITADERTTSVDWSKMHRRIEETQKKIEEGWKVSDNEKKRILKERAKLLAKEIDSGEDKIEYIEVVEFIISKENYGIESKFISEVYPLTEITPLPRTPSFVLGVMNIRGQIMSLIDLRRFFEIPGKGFSSLNKVIVLKSEQMEFAVLADEIIGVRKVPLDELQTTLTTLKGIQAKYLKGVTIDRLIVLETQKLLQDSKIVVNDETSTV